MKLAQSEPRVTVSSTDQVRRRAGIGVVHRAEGAHRARDDAEERRQQGERARELRVEGELGAALDDVDLEDPGAKTAAARAPTRVLRKLRASLSSSCRFSSAAPTTLSNVVPTNAAMTTGRHPRSTGRARPAAPSAASSSEAEIPASVPSSETAPSVPRGTGRKVVMRKVRRPRSWPISLDAVSAAAVAKEAAKARPKSTG